MSGRLVTSGVAALVIALAGCAVPREPLRFDAAAAAHVVLPGEPLDPAEAYVVVLPHLQNRVGNMSDRPFNPYVSTARMPQFRVWLTTSPDFGKTSMNIGINVPTDRPTLIRIPPGRYFVSTVFVASVFYDLEADDSMFDARPGQVNYPGDWSVTSGYHEITRGARPVGWYTSAMLMEAGSTNPGVLLADAQGAVAQLPVVYTRRPPARPAPGDH